MENYSHFSIKILENQGQFTFIKLGSKKNKNQKRFALEKIVKKIWNQMFGQIQGKVFHVAFYNYTPCTTSQAKSQW